MADRLLIRRDTSSNWTTNNPILGSGEPGYETDTRKIKYGDGVTPWASLPYFGAGGTISVDWNDLTGKPSTFTPSIHGHSDAVAGGSSGFMSGSDKTKLNGLNNYTHPVNHPPSIILQDANNRFVSDAEKSDWNSKLDNDSLINCGTW